jgi:hypothetical protein
MPPVPLPRFTLRRGSVPRPTPNVQKQQQNQQAVPCFGNPKEKIKQVNMALWEVYALQPNCSYKLVKICNLVNTPNRGGTGYGYNKTSCTSI